MLGTILRLFVFLAILPMADAATDTINFNPTTLSANSGPSNPASGATVVNGSSLAAGDVIVLDTLVVNVNGSQADNWGAINLNAGGYLGLTGAAFGILARTGNVNGSALYVNGVANNFSGSTAAVTNRVRIELYVAAAGSTTNLGYRALIDVGATGKAATIYTLSGTNLTFGGNSISVTFAANAVSESFTQNLPLTGAATSPASVVVLTNLSATFTASVTNALRTTQQWMKNGVFIPNATNFSYVTPPVTPGDNGAMFELVVSNDFIATNIVTSSGATLIVRSNGPGVLQFNFASTALAANTAASNPANGTVAIGGLELQSGDEVVFDGTIVNTAGMTNDNWGSVNFDEGGFYGITGATLGVLTRTGNAKGYLCNLYTNASGPLNFPGSSESFSNRVIISLYVSQTGSATNLGYLVQLDQGLTGVATTTLSGTNLSFSGNSIDLTFSAYQANELFVQNLPITGIHLQLPDTNLLAGASEPSVVTVDNSKVTNSVPTFNPGFVYTSSGRDFGFWSVEGGRQWHRRGVGRGWTVVGPPGCYRYERGGTVGECSFIGCGKNVTLWHAASRSSGRFRECG
jgi:hypothetical protein